MTQQTPADELKDVAADASSTATELGEQTAERVVDTFNEASANAANLAADTQKALDIGVEEFSKRLQGASASSQQTLEAFTRSSEIAAKAFQGIGREVATYTKTSFEEGLAAAQDLATAKTLAELFEKQTAFARSAFKSWVQQASKLSEIYTAAVKDIAAPMGQRISAAAEEVKV